jgi:protein-tyrosine phosphatase
VAHPARYRVVEDIVALARSWREAGAVLQINQASLTGRYGTRAERAAWSLLEAGLVDCLASDHHGRPHLALHVDDVVGRLEALGAEEQGRMLLRTNPLRIVEDLDPLPVLPVRMERGWRERLLRMIRPEAS